MHLEQFFAQKNKEFWEDGIIKLPERWKKIIEQNGKYFSILLAFNSLWGTFKIIN